MVRYTAIFTGCVPPANSARRALLLHEGGAAARALAYSGMTYQDGPTQPRSMRERLCLAGEVYVASDPEDPGGAVAGGAAGGAVQPGSG